MGMPTSDRKSVPEGAPPAEPVSAPRAPAGPPASAVREIDGRAGPEPTRFGDWEKDGRCIDF
jgi:hypothetical protein